MALIGRAGREESCVCVCGGERWNGCGVGGAMAIGTGGEELTTAENTPPCMTRIRGILHLPTMQHVKGASIKGKGRYKGIRAGAGRGRGAGGEIGVGGAGSMVVGAGTAGREGGGGAGGVGRGWSSGGHGGGPGAAATVQPRTFPPHDAGHTVPQCWPRSRKLHLQILRE
jgi:hypothetical protein